MPRHRARTGTRKSTIVSRTQRHGRVGYMRGLTMRLTVAAVATGALLWTGAWLYKSGTAQRWAENAAEKFYMVSTDHGFYVRDVLVEGRVNADPAVLLGLLNVGRGDPIFAFNPHSAREMLEKESWIKSARVERRLPGLVYVSITERVPYALWQHQGKVNLIDAEGFVLTDVKAEMARFSTLPLVVGSKAEVNAQQLLTLIRAEPEILKRLEAATYIGERRWDLKLKNGATVRLPEGDVSVSLRRLAEAQLTDRLLDKELESIDLRENNRLIVKTRPGTVQEYQANYSAEGAI